MILTETEQGIEESDNELLEETNEENELRHRSLIRRNQESHKENNTGS